MFCRIALIVYARIAWIQCKVRIFFVFLDEIFWKCHAPGAHTTGYMRSVDHAPRLNTCGTLTLKGVCWNVRDPFRGQISHAACHHRGVCTKAHAISTPEKINKKRAWARKKKKQHCFLALPLLCCDLVILFRHP